MSNRGVDGQGRRYLEVLAPNRVFDQTCIDCGCLIESGARHFQRTGGDDTADPLAYEPVCSACGDDQLSKDAH